MRRFLELESLAGRCVIERLYYNADSLLGMVRWFEERYELGSAELLELHRGGGRVDGLSESDRHLWLSVYRELTELGPTGFTNGVTQTLAGV